MQVYENKNKFVCHILSTYKKIPPPPSPVIRIRIHYYADPDPGAYVWIRIRGGGNTIRQIKNNSIIKFLKK